MRTRDILLATVSACLLLPVLPVHAAQQQIEEVTVTARKRQESILKVPVIESVITQQKLNQFGVHNLQSLSMQVPGLVMGDAASQFGLQVSIRGIGTSTLNAAIDQSVSLNLDGLQVSQGLAYEVGMFDLGQAEVLEGPQALFYGKSSPGGVIVLHSADPTDETDVMIRGGYEFEAAERTTELVVSGPVSDTLKLRLAGKYAAQDGFFKNVATGIPALGGLSPSHHDFAPREDYMVRGTAIWTPSEAFDVRVKVNYAKTFIDGSGGEMQVASCPGGTAPIVTPIPFLNPTQKCGISRTVHFVDLNPTAFPYAGNGGVPYTNLWQSYGTVEANYRPWPDLTITSVSGYYMLHQKALFDGTSSSMAGPALALENTFVRRDFTEELRANSSFDGPFNFTAGLFYQDAFMNEPTVTYFNTALLLPPYFQKGDIRIPIHTVSLFGQARYKILPDLELAAGARWSHEWRSYHEYADVIFGIPVAPGPVLMADPKLSSYHLNPEVTLTYTPTDDLTFYASYKEGSKSGSFDTSLLQPADTKVAFGDEGVSGGEGGVKGLLLDRRLSFSLAGYYYNYTNLQVGAAGNVHGQLVFRTQNAASSNIYGVELSGTYLPEAIDGLRLNGALSWNHARFDQFNNAECWGGQTIAEGCHLRLDPSTGLYAPVQDLSGRPLVRAPEWSASFGFDYDTSVWNDMTLSIASSTLFTSRYYTDLAERYDMIQHAFFKTNLSISLGAADGSWEVALIGNNLNNELTTGNCGNAAIRDGAIFGSAAQFKGAPTSGPEGPDAVICSVDRGREVWLRLTLHPLDLMH